MFTPQVTEFETITPEERAEQIAEYRRNQARDAEKRAAVTAAQAVQFAEVQRRLPDRPGGEPEADQRQTAATRAREQADAAHALAGTTPDVFKEEVLGELRGQLASLEREYIGAVERASHPDAYGDADQTPERMAETAIIMEEAVLAVRAKIAEVEGEPTEGIDA